jgi:rhodanese-related sulfurtransferase
LLDVRTIEEFNAAHIANALQANWNNESEFATRTNHLDKEKPLYIYCQAGGRSAAANNWLQKQGFKNIVELSGGMIAWKKENKPVVGVAPVTQFTKADLDKMMDKKDEVYLIDFGAAWCAPCVKMKPTIEELQKEYKGKFTFINIDAGVQINLQKEMAVESLPTFFVYKNDTMLMRFEGITTKEQFVKVMFK